MIAPVIAVVAMGEMGAGLAGLMVRANARVLTTLGGRSGESIARAGKAGVEVVGSEHALLKDADFFLSIVPPGVAKATAEHYAPILRKLDRKPVYVDCNAVSPQTVRDIGDTVASSNTEFVDACLLGVAPGPGRPMPRMFLSGAAARKVQRLADYGLMMEVLTGDIGQASALKCAYAALGKGLTAIAAWSILGAQQYGVADVFTREVAQYQSQLAATLTKLLPDMFPKAYRWIAEMQEIGSFLEAVRGGETGFDSIAQFYQEVAHHAGRHGADDHDVAKTIESFLNAPGIQSLARS